MYTFCLTDPEERPVIVGEIQERGAKSFSLGLNSEGAGWTVVNDTEESKPRSTRHDSEERDLSPPRRGNPDLSPPRRGRHDSPQRDLSPPRRARHDSPPKDLSPPRRRRHDSPAKDLSPPRRNRHDSPPKDLSPPRRRHGSPKRDLSPPRKRSSTRDQDLSPPRKTAKQEEDNRKLSSGGRAGLLSGKEVSHELQERKRKIDEKFKAADPSQLGKGAQTVYRDKHGKYK
jgi:pre-mRNA-splicing factor CWC26